MDNEIKCLKCNESIRLEGRQWIDNGKTSPFVCVYNRGNGYGEDEHIVQSAIQEIVDFINNETMYSYNAYRLTMHSDVFFNLSFNDGLPATTMQHFLDNIFKESKIYWISSKNNNLIIQFKKRSD